MHYFNFNRIRYSTQMSKLRYRHSRIILDQSVAIDAFHRASNDRRPDDCLAKTKAMNFITIQRGVVCPTVRPLKPDGDIKPDIIAPLIDWLIEKGVAGIHPLGGSALHDRQEQGGRRRHGRSGGGARA